MIRVYEVGYVYICVFMLKNELERSMVDYGVKNGVLGCFGSFLVKFLQQIWLTAAQWEEIGRASCRERVCLVV